MTKNRAMHPTMAWRTNELFCYFITMCVIDVCRQQLFPFLFAEWNIASSISFDDAWYIYNRIWLSCGAAEVFSHFTMVSSIEQTFGNNIIISNSFFSKNFQNFRLPQFSSHSLHFVQKHKSSLLFCTRAKQKIEIWRGLILQHQPKNCFE